MACPICGAEEARGGVPCPRCRAASDRSDAERTAVDDGRGAAAPRLEFAAGESFGDRYLVVERIGAGGQAHVFKARDKVTGRTVALKLLPPGLAEDRTHVERFRRELETAQRVDHPNVCRLYEGGEAEGLRYISMEYVDGQTLQDWVRAVGRLSPQQTLGVAVQICDGLEAAHREGIVHRDLKPQNIMLDKSGRVVVMDFGLAYRADAEPLTAAGGALGTLAYLSPEQARAEKVDARSDIYALGLVLYEMLTGVRPPGDGKSLPLALRDPDEPCPPPSAFAPEVPAELDRIVLRCLEAEPDRRYESAAGLRRELAALAASSSLGRLGEGAVHGSAPRAGRARSLAVLLALLALLAAAVGVWVARRPAPPARAATVAIETFAYEGPDESRYLASLVPAAVEGALRRSGALDVVALDGAHRFGPSEPPETVARQLGVGHVVQGRLRREGDRVELSMRLVDREGVERASGRVEGTMARLFESVDELAGRIARAMGPFAEPAVAAPPSKALEAYLRGMNSLEGWDLERSYEKAAAAFEEALAEEESFAEAWAGLARARWREYEETRAPHLVEEALEAARRAVALRPDLPESFLALGEVQLGRGRSAEAAASFAEAQRLAPADDAVLRRIGDAYAALGRNDEAERAYRRAIGLRPGYWHNWNAAGSFYYGVGRYEDAKEMFREVIRLRPQADTGYVNLAAAHIASGEIASAEPLLEAAVRLSPSWQVHNNLGFVYYATGRYEDAVAAFRRAIESGGAEQDSPWGNLGDALRRAGRMDEARRAYRRAIELGRGRLAVNPADVETRASVAMALAGAGECAAARREAARLFDGGGSARPVLDYYAALAYALCGDGAAARRHVRRAIEGGMEVDVRHNPDLAPLVGAPRR